MSGTELNVKLCGLYQMLKFFSKTVRKPRLELNYSSSFC